MHYFQYSLLAVILGCSSPPTMPAPSTWEEASLPPGVLAEANIVTQKVKYSKQLLKLPPLVVAAIILHEVCHLRGEVSEYDADCCAATLYTSLYGLASTADIIMFWQDRRQDAVVPWMTCSF